MKQILFAAAALLMLASRALAIEPTPTPPVPPTETGEDKAPAQQILDMARLKLGQCTVAITVATSAGSGTCNGASGIISLSAATAGASGATPSVITVSNSKVQAGDIVMCEVATGGTAGAVVECSPAITAGQVVFTIQSATPTALASSSISLFFLVLTKGNPN